MFRQSRTSLLIFVAGCLAGCAATTNDGLRETLPSYASPVNNNMGWAVKCPQQTITNPLNRNFEIFRNADGSFKSHEQFCQENDSTRRTGP